ncbi:uncharacterized protein LODBEIA_P48910 [Lodderomyces beijingensis]|uniref:Uncharacterized protein n=1 Tax=Lodderomyces beijingensis TaxID=1775926 RepID=A0ABP0ZVM7_9ASCO
MQFATVLSLASVALALNLDQIRLVNDDELIIQDAQYGYPTIVNLAQEDAEVEGGKKKEKAPSSSSSYHSSASASSSSASKSHSTTVSKSLSTSVSTTTKHHSTSKSTQTYTYSITKTGGAAEAVNVANVGGSLLFALGLLL